jgi:outer membrane immunogenic protein
MRTASVFFAAMLAGTASAAAADWRAPMHHPQPFGGMYQPQPVASWTGFYLGANIGAISARPYIDIPVRLDRSTGVVGGVMAGYMGQAGRVVGAIEADIGPTSISEGSAFSGFGLTISEKRKLDWFGTMRGRVGYLVTPELLAFASGGFAFARGAHRITASGPAGTVTLKEDEWHFGWTLGAGLEALLGHNWLVRGEYLYYDLGKKRYWSSVIPGGAEIGVRGHIGRAAINYRF